MDDYFLELWPGLLPPDYLLNIAALQSLQQQQQPTLPPSMMDGNGETFNDFLKKMPRVSTTTAATADGEQFFEI